MVQPGMEGFRERLRIGAVVSGCSGHALHRGIEGRLPGSRGKADDDVSRDLQVRQAALLDAPGKPACVRGRVAAAVEEKKAALRSSEQHGLRHGLGIVALLAQAAPSQKLRVGPHEVVFAFELDAVTREVKHRRASPGDGVLEGGHPFINPLPVRILQVNDREASPFQGGLDERSVVAAVAQIGKVAFIGVVVVSDDKSDPVRSSERTGTGQQGGDERASPFHTAHFS